jgi:hypothetical protein
MAHVRRAVREGPWRVEYWRARVQPWLMTARSGADPRRRRPLPACFVHTAVAIILLDVAVR